MRAALFLASLLCLVAPTLAHAGEEDCPRPVAITRPPNAGSPWAKPDVTRMDTQTSDNVRITGGCIAAGTIAGAAYLDSSRGVEGDGAANDATAIQRIIDAHPGGTIYGMPGKTYRVTSQMYLNSDNLTLDCRGATIWADGSPAALFNVGIEGTPTAQELAADNVKVRNCRFRGSDTLAFRFKPGSCAEIYDNVFVGESPYRFDGIVLSTARTKCVKFHHNYLEDMRGIIFLKADPKMIGTQTTVSSSSPCSGSPADGTTWAVPSAIQTSIASGFGYFIEVDFASNDDNYLLFGPYHGYTSSDIHGFSYNSTTGCFTFNAALDPTATSVILYTWNPQTGPSNDAQSIDISHNEGYRFRDSAVQFSCNISDLEWKVPFQDCPRGIRVAYNRLSQPYQAEGMVSNIAVGVSGTNRVLYSRDYTNAAWTKEGLGTPVTGIWAPPWDYQKTAQRLVEDTSTGQHRVFQAVGGNAASTDHTASFILKGAERTKARISVGNGSGDTAYADVDLKLFTVTGSGTEGGGASVTNVSTGVQPMGMGWARYWVTVNIAASSLRSMVRIKDASGAMSYTGDGASGIEIWDTQLEEGSYPTIMKPSLGSTAGRIGSNLISLNGIDSASVIGNTLGPCADQCLHVEDHSGHTIVSGNTARDVGAFAYAINNSWSYTLTDNAAFNVGNGCYRIHATTGGPHAPPTFSTDIENRSFTMLNNSCDGYNNPGMQFGYSLATMNTMNLNLNNPPPVNLPSTALAYTFLYGRFNFLGASNDNMALNPGFSIDQDREGAAYTATGPVMDGWRFDLTSAATGVTVKRTASGHPSTSSTQAIVEIGTGNATVNAGDVISLAARIPGDRMVEAGFGTADAKTLSLSWEQRCSIAGTYNVAIQNGTPNRSFVHPFSVLEANTWEPHYAVIPGDTGGAWSTTASSLSIQVKFVFEAGTTFQTATADRWQGANLIATSAQTQISQTTGATCEIANAKLEIANTPTNLRRRPLQAELAMAQRFYRKTFPQATRAQQNAGLAGARCVVATNTTAGALSLYMPFDPPMNTAPTITTYNPSAANANWRNVTGASDAVVLVDPSTAIGTTGVQIGEQTTALTVGNNYCIHVAADARL